MNITLLRSLCVVAAVFAVTATAQDNAAQPESVRKLPPVTLHVGDPAPAFRFGAWLKGERFDHFAPGKVYVMEFWATWCGPCRGAMPHLSALARKYADRVIFTGVNVWESTKPAEKAPMAKIEAFVKNARDMMAYNVAVDTESVIMKGVFGRDWLMAAGQLGIPSTFVIGKDGRIAWIGNPMLGLDEVLALVLEDKLDAKAAADIAARYKAMVAESNGLRQQLAELQKAGDAERVIAFVDDILARNSLLEDAAIPAKFRALASLDRNRARAYAGEIIRSHGNAPFVLRSLALLAMGEATPDPDYSLAVRLMEAAMQNSTPTDIVAAPTMAEAYFRAGETAKAIAIQEGVVDALKEEREPKYAEHLESQERVLAKYRAALAGKGAPSSR